MVGASSKAADADLPFRGFVMAKVMESSMCQTEHSELLPPGSGKHFLACLAELASLALVKHQDHVSSGCPTHRQVVWKLLP